ncbi:MAG: hypothetical protein IT581_16235 [Verrucomicrobiales bacterium]|nr:hypothetical protein [Verrucomicrobiales bacterium]
MRSSLPSIIAAFITVVLPTSLLGQSFDAGSTGALGALNVTDADVTVDLPPDGRLNYTAVNVEAGRTLRFRRNALNTPVYLLAQGVVTINGTIDVSGSGAPSSPPIGGAGGPGGFDGGKPGFGSEFGPSDGYGPGAGGGGTDGANAAGNVGAGAYGTARNGAERNGAVYGSPLLIPLLGGSGGGGIGGQPGQGGGGGGGAILIASNARIEMGDSGVVRSNGGDRRGGTVNSGSGGAIRLLAPKVSGTGILNVFGGNNSSFSNHGRIRVDCLDKTSLTLRFQPNETTTVGANMFVDPFGSFAGGQRRVPRLDIIDAAGTAIPLNTGSTVQVQLPFGSSTNRTITIRAQDFNADVPIRLTLTPDNGPRSFIDTNIVNTASNPATLVVPVVLPVNNLVTIHAWTR